MIHLPLDFPHEFAKAAFRPSNGEAAWPPSMASLVAQWFGDHGYGVLGTELWVVRDDGTICSLPIGKSGQSETHGNTVNRNDGEAWDSFTRRAAAETSEYLKSFDPAEITEAGDLRFNLSWVTEAEFDHLSDNE